MPGSGKSTVADRIAKQLGYSRESMGNFQRELAKKHKMTLDEWGKYQEKHPESDKEVDEYHARYGREHDDFIMDSRLGFHFIPDSLKIFLRVDPYEGARRIYDARRQGEKGTSIDDIQALNERRVESERIRYTQFYGLDHYDMKNYDIVFDTTAKTVNECVNLLLSAIENHKKKR